MITLIFPTSESELIAAAARCGARVSPTQPKRLRMAGLVPRPTQDLPAGYRGSVASYPARAVKQLCDLVAFRGERRLDHLVVLAWWNGFDVTPADARAAAVRVLDRMSGRFAKLLAERALEPCIGQAVDEAPVGAGADDDRSDTKAAAPSTSPPASPRPRAPVYSLPQAQPSDTGDQRGRPQRVTAARHRAIVGRRHRPWGRGATAVAHTR
jgi:hypothetical protein